MDFEESQRPTKRACHTSVSVSPPPEHEHDSHGEGEMDGPIKTEHTTQHRPSDSPVNIQEVSAAEPSIPGLGTLSAQSLTPQPQPENNLAHPKDQDVEVSLKNDHIDATSMPTDQVVDHAPGDLKDEEHGDNSTDILAAETSTTSPQALGSTTQGDTNYLLDAVGENLKQEAGLDARIDIPTIGPPETEIAGERNHLPDETMQANAEGEAEWEVDSSPYESSDSSTSEESSSEDSDSEDDPDYAMLDPEEQARILMQGDGGSDDEGPSRGRGGGGGHVRTANEKTEEIIPKPDIVVTPEMVIEELGSVEATVENTVLVRGKTSGEYRVLETGSVLCLKDRTVIGVVAETLGRVQQPLYTVRFTNDAAIQEVGLSEKGTPVFYVENHSTFVFTQPLKTVKGSDASNVNDEEVGDDEMEFSDDEAEAEHKRQLKNKRQNRRDARNGVSGPHKTWTANERSNYPSEDNASMYDDTPEINYDDVNPQGDDGYTPLARPTNLPELMGQKEPPTEGWRTSATNGHLSGSMDRGRGRGSLHRGHRGRGRGDGNRGGGRDRRHDYPGRVNEQRGNRNSSMSQNNRSMGPPSWPQPSAMVAPSAFSYGQQPPSPYGSQGSHVQPVPQPPSLSPQNSQQMQFSPSPISPLPSQQFQWPSPHQPLPPSPQQHLAVPPAGAHLNPAFFHPGQAPFSGQMSYGSSASNSAAFAQVQAQLDMLRRSQNHPR